MPERTGCFCGCLRCSGRRTDGTSGTSDGGIPGGADDDEGDNQKRHVYHSELLTDHWYRTKIPTYPWLGHMEGIFNEVCRQ